MASDCTHLGTEQTDQIIEQDLMQVLGCRKRFLLSSLQ
jgi:hypothetical protein